MAYEEMTYRVYDNGYEQYEDGDGAIHNPKGWAIKTSGGTKGWYIHGRAHREDGPAIERTGGHCYYYLNGNEHLREEWEIVRNFSHDWFKHAQHTKSQEMTVAEIAEALGHEVKVVK